MLYLWTEDTGAGLHYWQLANEHLFQNAFIVESKGSNQGLLDAVRELVPQKDDLYYLAFDIVYDNMDVMNKYLELKSLADRYPSQLIILDMLCFEYIILSFGKLVAWTGTNKKDKIAIRDEILSTIKGNKIEVDSITDLKTREYLMGFKRYSTERVIKSVTYELTENDAWSVKGNRLGMCWYLDCCAANNNKTRCNVEKRTLGKDKIREVLFDIETQRIVKGMNGKCI